MIKMSVHQGDITIINMYEPQMRTPKYMKQNLIELNGKINNSSVIVLGHITAS